MRSQNRSPPQEQERDVTRNGELGCPNCDGPCIGCWEMTDTEKRVAEIEAQLDDDTTTCVEIVTKHVGWLLAELRASQAECKRIGDLYAEEQDYRRNYGKGESLDAAKRIMEMCVRDFGKYGIGVMEQRVASDIKTYALAIIEERDAARAQLAEAVALLKYHGPCVFAETKTNNHMSQYCHHCKRDAFLATVTT